MKCVICKAFNARQEAMRHPNYDTLTSFRLLLNRLSSREETAVASICEEHRNPLRFNVCVTDLFKTAIALAEVAKRGIPITEQQLSQLLKATP
jgi:hypothetical protein